MASLMPLLTDITSFVGCLHNLIAY